MPNEEDSPATKRDMNELRAEMYQFRDDVRTDMHEFRAEMRTDMHQLRAELHTEMHHLRDELIEKMREMQTEVLRAFYDWARPVEGRLRNLDEVSTRLGLLEERVTAIEKRNFGL